MIIGCLPQEIDKTTKEFKELRPKSSVTVLELDLSSLQSVRKFAKEVTESESRIDILINNAGVLFANKWLTEDGLQTNLEINYLGNFSLELDLENLNIY